MAQTKGLSTKLDSGGAVNYISKNDFLLWEIDNSKSYAGSANVNALKAKIKSGVELDPIRVFRDVSDKTKWNIYDGSNRFQAYNELGIKKIPVIEVNERGIPIPKTKSQLTDFYNQTVKGGGSVPDTTKLIDQYKAAGKSDLEGFTKADEKLSDILTELELSQAGKREGGIPAHYEQGRPVDAQTFVTRSTFPKWLPEHLRDKKLFDAVMGNLDIEKLKYPEGNRPRQRELYDALLAELDKRLGVDTAPTRANIMKSYEPKSTAVSDSGASGGVRPEPETKATTPGSQRELEAGHPGTELLQKTDTRTTRERVKGLPAGIRTFRENIPQNVKPFNELYTKFIEYVQSTEERVRQLTTRKDLDLTKDPYETMTLFHGRVGQKIEEGYDIAEDIADDIISLVGRKRSDVEIGRHEVSEYLQALHAPERNAALGSKAAGMTDEDAKAILAAAKPESSLVDKPFV